MLKGDTDYQMKLLICYDHQKYLAIKITFLPLIIEINLFYISLHSKRLILLWGKSPMALTAAFGMLGLLPWPAQSC